MDKPQYFGKVVSCVWPCSVCKKKGNVWRWFPNILGQSMSMDAHEACFKRVWAGEK
jgi:hypothetical protein